MFVCVSCFIYVSQRLLTYAFILACMSMCIHVIMYYMWFHAFVMFYVLVHAYHIDVWYEVCYTYVSLVCVNKYCVCGCRGTPVTIRHLAARTQRFRDQHPQENHRGTVFWDPFPWKGILLHILGAPGHPSLHAAQPPFFTSLTWSSAALTCPF